MCNYILENKFPHRKIQEKFFFSVHEVASVGKNIETCDAEISREDLNSLEEATTIKQGQSITQSTVEEKSEDISTATGNFILLLIYMQFHIFTIFPCFHIFPMLSHLPLLSHFPTVWTLPRTGS